MANMLRVATRELGNEGSLLVLAKTNDSRRRSRAKRSRQAAEHFASKMLLDRGEPRTLLEYFTSAWDAWLRPTLELSRMRRQHRCGSSL
jgi:hypothetical protein